jgi:hypothetical protein
MTVEITSHKVNGLNDAIQIEATDEPGYGNAHHVYCLSFLDEQSPAETFIRFQNGPIKEAGYNGLSNEALLAIVEHQLQCFQSGPFACRENALALTHLQESMHWLHHRTRERMSRGVEGTLAK